MFHACFALDLFSYLLLLIRRSDGAMEGSRVLLRAALTNQELNSSHSKVYWDLKLAIPEVWLLSTNSTNVPPTKTLELYSKVSQRKAIKIGLAGQMQNWKIFILMRIPESSWSSGLFLFILSISHTTWTFKRWWGGGIRCRLIKRTDECAWMKEVQ